MGTRRVTLFVGAFTLSLALGTTLALLTHGSQSTASSPAVPDAVLAKADSEQAVWLKDGAVSSDEYSQAIAVTTECLTNAGFSVSVDRPLSRSTALFRVSGDLSAGTESVKLCMSAHFDAANYMWSRQNQPSAREYIDARAALRECLMGGGAERVPEVLDEGFIREMLAFGTEAELKAFFQCADQVKQAFGFKP
jgi:hypothetical protein